MPQSPQNTVRVPSPSDRSVFEFADKVLSLQPDSRMIVQLAGRQLGGEYDSSADFIFDNSDIDFSKSSILGVVQMRTGPGNEFTVAFHRYVTEYNSSGGQIQNTSMWEGEITVFPTQNNPGDPRRLANIWREVDVFRSKLLGKPKAAAIGVNNVMDIGAQQLVKLTELHASILHEAEAARLKQETTLAERKAALEADQEQRRKALEEEVKIERALLRAQSDALEARQKELDDRGHMHARRELRAQIMT